MRKVVFNVAIKTALVVIGIGIIAIILVTLLLPGRVASFSAAIGNYTLAANYAQTVYKRSGDVHDLDQCFTYAIDGKIDSSVVTYGTQLADHADFVSLCQEKENNTLELTGVITSYKQYVYGTVAKSYCAMGLESSGVVYAKLAVGDSFERNCALASLALWSLAPDRPVKNIASVKSAIVQVMDSLDVEHTEYFNSIYSALISE